MMLIPNFDSETGQCVSLHWKTPTDQYVLIPIRRNGNRSEANPDDLSYGYLAQQIIDSSEYLDLDLSDRPPQAEEPHPPQLAQDWTGLGSAIATSPLYQRITSLIESNDLEPQVETTLLSTLFQMGMAAAWTQNLEAFLTGVNKIRETLSPTDYPITPEEENQIALMLVQYGFMPA